MFSRCRPKKVLLKAKLSSFYWLDGVSSVYKIHLEVFYKKVILEIWHNSLGNACARISSQKKIFKNTGFVKHLPTATSVCNIF